MAKRKGWQNALAGLGEGITNASGFLLRQRAQDRSQDRYDERQKENALAIADRQEAQALRQFALGVQSQVAKGEIDPEQAAAILSSVVGEQVAPSALAGARPSMRRRMGGRFDKSIADAKAASDLPTDEDFASALMSEGAETLPADWSAGMMPAVNDPFQNFADASVGREYSGRVGAKRRAIEGERTEKIDGTDNQGRNFTRMLTKAELADPFYTSPDATTQGTLAGQQDVAKNLEVLGNDELTDLKGTTQARIENLVESLTRQAKVNTAFATAGASKRASLEPDIVAAEVDRNRQLNSGKENSTESERRAATNWAPLVNAHSKALDLEARGASIGTWDDFMTKVPLANRMVAPATRQYMQAARDFISTLGLIRSGVTVRPDEAESLFSTMFRTTGDDATSSKAKQQSREVFLASMQAMVGRSGDEAGRILAEAINKRQIPESVLSSLSFDNPQLKKALLDNLIGTPQFDINGNPIGVRK